MENIVFTYKKLTSDIIADKTLSNNKISDIIKAFNIALPFNMTRPEEYTCYGAEVDEDNYILIIRDKENKYTDMMAYIAPVDNGPLEILTKDNKWVHIIPYIDDPALTWIQNMYNNFGELFMLIASVYNFNANKIMNLQFISKYASVQRLIAKSLILNSEDIIDNKIPVDEFNYDNLFRMARFNAKNTTLYDIMDCAYESLDKNKAELKAVTDTIINDKPDAKHGGLFVFRFYWNGIEHVYRTNQYSITNNMIRTNFHKESHCLTCILRLESFDFNSGIVESREDALLLEDLFKYIQSCIDETANYIFFKGCNDGCMSLNEYKSIIAMKNSINDIHNRMIANFFTTTFTNKYKNGFSLSSRYEDTVSTIDTAIDPNVIAVDFDIVSYNKKIKACTPEFEGKIISIRNQKVY